MLQCANTPGNREVGAALQLLSPLPRSPWKGIVSRNRASLRSPPCLFVFRHPTPCSPAAANRECQPLGLFSSPSSRIRNTLIIRLSAAGCREHDLFSFKPCTCRTHEITGSQQSDSAARSLCWKFLRGWPVSLQKAETLTSNAVPKTSLVPLP